MKIKTVKSFFCIILIFLFSCCVTPPQSGQIETEQLVTGIDYYGIEIDGQLCGYVESSTEEIIRAGKKTIKIEENMFLMLTLFGSNINSKTTSISYTDPVTKKCNFLTLEIEQGTIKQTIVIEIDDGHAKISSSIDNNIIDIEITPDIIFGDLELLHILKNDFFNKPGKEKVYKILYPMENKVQTTVFTRLKDEEINILDKTFQTVVFTQLVKESGISFKVWYDFENKVSLKVEVNNRTIYKTDHTVVDKIKVINIDNSLITKTNVAISDIQSIIYMKIDAKIQPTGVNLTLDDLNVEGQTFTGQINNNLIEGIFEIEYKRYQGENAPPFPQSFHSDDPVAEYLLPGDRVESGDPVLIKKAREITEGSMDSWEAACRLSQWVGNNIAYGIPGGGTPRKTYDMKAGECGAHSFLVATFCRAVGIPARVVWGGMYTPNFQGSFGQHAWNEIYMGDAGWIPVDSTAFEYDYVDSGHIRIGEYVSPTSAFNGKHFEILDYRLDINIDDIDRLKTAYSLYLGTYSGNNIEVEVKIAEGNIVLEIPGSPVLPMAEPDENDRWYCKLSPLLYVKFIQNKADEKIHLNLYQIISLQRKADIDENDDNIPDELKPITGLYYYAAVNTDFKIFYKNEKLQFDNILNNEIIDLFPTESPTIWSNKEESIIFNFVYDESRNVKSIDVDSISRFTKK